MKLKFKFIAALALVLVILSSCNRGNYVNNLPKNAVAIISVNGVKLVGPSSPFYALLMPFVNEEQTQLKGIDLTKDIYFFKTADGILGACLPIADDYEFHDFIKRLYTVGGVVDLKMEKDFNYCSYKHRWVLVYNEYCLLIMGPTIMGEGQKMAERMMSQMDDDEETSCQGTDLWEHLMKSNEPIRFAARASALPEQVTQLFTFGVPTGTDLEDIIVEARMKYEDGALYMNGNTCSALPHVKQAMDKAYSIYRPLTTDWKKHMNDSVLATIFMNVNGKDFLNNFKNSKTVTSFLQASEVYDEIATKDGEISFVMTPRGENILEKGVKVEINDMPAGAKANKEHVVGIFNINYLFGLIGPTIIPAFDKISRIVFTIEDPMQMHTPIEKE